MVTALPLHTGSMADADDLDALDTAYENAERAYLDALRAADDHTKLGRLSAAVARAADVYNTAAYAKLHALEGTDRDELDYLTERTEVLRSSGRTWRGLRGGAVRREG